MALRPAAARRTAARWLPVSWLLAARLMLGMDGRLPAFLAWVLPGSVLVLGVRALVHQQLAPPILDWPMLPERYRVADDLRQPLAVVVAIAEQEAMIGGLEAPDKDRRPRRSL